MSLFNHIPPTLTLFRIPERKVNINEKINEILRISFYLVLGKFELLQDQRDETTEKHGQENHGGEISTKKKTLVLQVCF